MVHCANCEGQLQVTRTACRACGLDYEGQFCLPRLARLAPGEQALIEQVILAGANLKEVATSQEVSYPTFRKRLDALISTLRDLRDEDERRCEAFLEEVEAGTMQPEKAARLIKELNHGG